MLTLVVAILTCGGCSSDERLQGPGRSPDPPPALARPVVSRLSAPAGSRIAIAIEAVPQGGAVLSGLQGELRFDPAALRYAGQEGYDSLVFPLVIVNDAGAGAGTLRVLSLDPAGLSPRTAILAFDVLRADYAGTLRYTTDMAVTTALAVLPDGGTSTDVGEDAALRIPAAPIRLGPADWTRLEATWGLGARLIDSIPTGRRFGDVTGNGAVDVVDASRVGNWAVGNPSPAGTPIPAPGELAELVGNVAPFNSPGLGETADSKGPGWDANCVRLWDVLDASNISNEAVGTDRPVVGELVPADGFDAATGLPRRGAVCLPYGSQAPPIRDGTDPIPTPLPIVQDPLRPGFTHVRNYFEVAFQDTVSGAGIAAFLTTFRARIIGGSGTRIPGFSRYYILTPDPGPAWTSYDSLRSAIRQFPGVAHVLDGGSGTVIVRGRYPVDPALAASRSAWFTGNSVTQPWRAVRAPLAWGCETGEYGGALARVGVIDLSFDVVPTDIAGWSRPVPFTDTLYSDTLHWKSAGWNWRHSARVASLLAARGDNASGIAGIIWSADLSLYPLGHDIVLPVHFYRRFLDIVAHAGSSASPRQVLNLSVSLGDPTNESDIALLHDIIEQEYLAPNPSGLLVMALGDVGTRLSLAQLADSTFVDQAQLFGIGALDRALARLSLSPDYGSRILFVAGVDATVTLPDTSNWILGASTIGAPGYGITTLDPDGTPVIVDGSSYSTPFVSGVAASLYAMDPTLTPAQVKDYILRGAQEPKFDPFTGQYISDSLLLQVQGAPEPVYQLDAYGSLSLLSRERQGLPVCGFRVSIQGASPNRYLWLERNIPEVLSLPSLGGPLTYHSPSLAQGGRRLAVSQYDPASSTPSVLEYDLQGSTWTLSRTLPGQYRRTYLEADTVDQVEVNGTDSYYATTITGPGRLGLIGLNLGRRVVPGALWVGDYWAPVASPDGEHAIIKVSALDPACPAGDDQWTQAFVVPVASGAATPLVPGANTCGFDYFNAMATDALWYPTGDRFVWAELDAYADTAVLHPRRLADGTVVADGPDVSLGARQVVEFHDHAQRINPEGHRMLLVEALAPLVDCRVVTRSTTAGFPILQEEPINNDCLAPITPLIRRPATSRARATSP